jgi:hypothetical protein
MMLSVCAGCSDRSLGVSTDDTSTEIEGSTGDMENGGQYCGHEELGCVFSEYGEAEELACVVDCSLPNPCPTSVVETEHGHGVDRSDPACIVDAILTMTEPIELRYGVVADINPMHDDFETTQWSLWVLGAGHVVMLEESEYAELGTMGEYGVLRGGALPDDQALSQCLEEDGDMAWTCLVMSTMWCAPSSMAGPTGMVDWCPSNEG